MSLRRIGVSWASGLVVLSLIASIYAGHSLERQDDRLVLFLPTHGKQMLRIEGFFLQTPAGRTVLGPGLEVFGDGTCAQGILSDGRRISIKVWQEGLDYLIKLSSDPNVDVIKWGLNIEAGPKERFTGLMERVVDGPQQASWAPGIKHAMDLRGQQVEMILKPTTSVYAPFYISSAGYATFVKGTWPGLYDFCATIPDKVRIEFEGPVFEMKVYIDLDPMALVQRHAMDAGPPILPPRWMFTPWRWRDEHRHRTQYYDGTPVRGPFNSEVMEDILMMEAFEIPCGVYWVDRPYGPGRLGYDDFEIDPNRLPNFSAMVRWLNSRGTQMVLWIGPFFQGQMEKEGLERGYNLPGQRPMRNNYPLCDFTNPQAKAFWQEGLSKLVKLGVAGFKLDRAEEDIPENGPYQVYDGRSIRENRNAYPFMYLQAAYELVRKYRGEDFVLMPRAAYTGSARYGVFWGGDIGGTQEGLRASIIAVQRSAVMGYPYWGSDTCGYNQQLMEQEVCARWLAFSSFCPIMEVGPTRNVGFWNLPRQPSYDSELIAVWRLYGRLHQRLVDYAYQQAIVAHKTGTPIVRPVCLVDPNMPDAWENWWTYMYGPDIVVSPIWQKGQRTQQVYLPKGARWQWGWDKAVVFEGGRTVTVKAEMHQIPFFVRAGAELPIGDLEQEYRQSKAIAEKKPDLARLEAQVREWFEKNN